MDEITEVDFDKAVVIFLTAIVQSSQWEHPAKGVAVVARLAEILKSEFPDVETDVIEGIRMLCILYSRITGKRDILQILIGEVMNNGN